MADQFKIAAVQSHIEFADIRANLDMIAVKSKETKADGAQLTVFPEAALSGYCFESKEEAMVHAISRDSKEIDELSDLAQQLDMNIATGLITRSDNDLFNSLVVLHRDGSRSWYDKTHLPTLGVDCFVTPGTQALEPIEVDGVKVGLGICYDGSFPETARVLSLRGAEVIILPTNWPSTSGCTADYVPNTRAMENHIYFVAVNRIGEERGFTFIGKSRIVAPGGITMQLADDSSECIISASIEPAIARDKLLVNVPGKHQVDRIADRRPDLYDPIVQAN